MSGAEIMSRRFRAGYRDMRASGRDSEALESIKRHGERSRLRRLGLKKKTDKTL